MDDDNWTWKKNGLWMTTNCPQTSHVDCTTFYRPKDLQWTVLCTLLEMDSFGRQVQLSSLEKLAKHWKMSISKLQYLKYGNRFWGKGARIRFFDPKLVQFGIKIIKIGQKSADLALFPILVDFCSENPSKPIQKTRKKWCPDFVFAAGVPGRNWAL